MIVYIHGKGGLLLQSHLSDSLYTHWQPRSQAMPSFPLLAVLQVMKGWVWAREQGRVWARE